MTLTNSMLESQLTWEMRRVKILELIALKEELDKQAEPSETLLALFLNRYVSLLRCYGYSPEEIEAAVKINMEVAAKNG